VERMALDSSSMEVGKDLVIEVEDKSEGDGLGEMDENDGREFTKSLHCDEDDDGGRLVVVATIGADVDEDDTEVTLDILEADFPRMS
jgi:hypothetical protein